MQLDRRNEALYLIRQGLLPSEVGEKLGIHKVTIRKWAKDAGLALTKSEGNRISYERGLRSGEAQRRKIQRYSLNETIFREPLTEATAWVLGVIVGDGCIVRHKDVLRGVSVLGDKDVCENVRNIMGSNAPIHAIPGTFEVRFNNGPLAHSMVECWGITPDKSRTVPFPNVPDELISHFVRGLWDSDGCVYALKAVGQLYPAVSYCSYSRTLIDRVSEIAREVTGSTVKPTAVGEGWMFGLTNQKARTFADWLWKGSTPEIRGDRKYKLFYELASKPTARQLNRAKWDEIRKEAMVLFEQGKSPQQISDMLDLGGPQTVNLWLRQASVVRNSAEITDKRLASRRAKRAAKLVDIGSGGDTLSSSSDASISCTP